MTNQEFIEALQELNINLTSDKLQKLEQFYNLLVTWNEKINLTTITNHEEVYLKHFYDSLTLIKAIDLTKDLKVLDVGTGAGFPGIVLKIVFPNLKVTLLDSMTKRINYLDNIIKELNLKDIETKCLRVEDYAKTNREIYDLVVARAVAHLGILTETCLPLVKVQGFFIAMKAKVEDEIKEANKIISEMQAEIVQRIEFSLPKENSLRNLVCIQKLAKTNLKYPRRYDKIKKEYLKKD